MEYNTIINKIYEFAVEIKNYARISKKNNKVEELAYLAEKLGYTIRLSYGVDTFIDSIDELKSNSDNDEFEFYEFYEDEKELQKLKEQRIKTIEESKNIGLDFTNDTSKVIFESFDVDINDDDDIIIGSDEEESKEESEEESEEEEVPITRKRTMKLKYDFE